MAVKKTIEIDVKAQDAISQIDELQQGIEGVDEATVTAELGFKNLTTGITATGTAFKAMGVGLIVAAFVKLKDMLGENQVVMDAVTRASESVGFVFNALINTAIELGQKMFKAFSDPKQAVIDLWAAIKANIANRIEGLIDTFGALGNVIKSAFSRDLEGLKEGLADAKTGFVQLATGMTEVQQNTFVENLKEQSKQLRNSIRAANDYGKAVSNLRKEVELATAKQEGLRLEFQREAEIERQRRDDINLTLQERIGAAQELAAILDEQFIQERELAQKRLDLAQLELEANETNVGLQVALQEAKNNMAEIDERITSQRSEQLTQLKSLEKEYNDSLIKETKKTGKEVLKVDKKTGKDRLKTQQAINAAKKAATIDAGKSILSGIGQLAGEGTRVGKAAAIAQILIDTASGISSAIAGASAAGAASGPAAPVTTPLLIAQLVGTVLTGIGQAKAILGKVKDGGGAGELSGIDSAAPSAGGAVSVPDVEPEEVGPTGLGPLVPNIEAITTAAQPIQAYVVENDISSSQALQEELEVQATL
tara:strand:+ start:6779 stop:8392 length:1614 start_codon:yes stop_codon:yes gene_type:complete